MINGNVSEFVNHIYYGDELWFKFEGEKFFLEGWNNDGILELTLFEMKENGMKYVWKGNSKQYPAEDFLDAPIWNGKTFWEVENEIEWVDE